MPFPFAPSQVGGGSEFAAEFDKTVISWDSGLFVPPPRPKRNGSVALKLAQSHCTWTPISQQRIGSTAERVGFCQVEPAKYWQTKAINR
jgi:hypothetical protein